MEQIFNDLRKFGHADVDALEENYSAGGQFKVCVWWGHAWTNLKVDVDVEMAFQYWMQHTEQGTVNTRPPDKYFRIFPMWDEAVTDDI